MAEVHRTAVVDRSARLEEGVEIGPYCVVEGGVHLGRGTRLLAHALVGGGAVLGEGNVVHPFAVLGAPAQSRRQKSACPVRIGDGNVFREHVTVHAGTERETRVGRGNLFMVGCHVAHDVHVGDECTVANGVQLAGHVTVEDGVTFGGLAAVAQFVRVGEGAFVAGGAMVERDVPPFVIVQGDRARVRALNTVGLKRRGAGADSVAELRRVFRAVFASGVPRAEALARVRTVDPLAGKLLAALRAGSSRSR
jgi:UDP-N-acetylglucosamine acyltransferase